MAGGWKTTRRTLLHQRVYARKKLPASTRSPVPSLLHSRESATICNPAVAEFFGDDGLGYLKGLLLLLLPFDKFQNVHSSVTTTTHLVYLGVMFAPAQQNPKAATSGF